MDLSLVSGCATGVWLENNGGVYWYPTADNPGVHGNLPDPQQMQTGQAKEGSGTTPLVVEIAHGPGRQRHIWIRQVMVNTGFRSRFCMGMSMPGGYEMTVYSVHLSLV